MAIFKRKKSDAAADDAQSKTEKKAETSKKSRQKTKADGKKEAGTKNKKPAKDKKEKKTATVKLGVQGSEFVIKPLITEKTATLASANQYVFVVSRDANRSQIKTAFSSMYGIKPVSVNIQNVQGKRVRFGRVQGKRKDWKKAIVTLPEGKTINVYDGV